MDIYVQHTHTYFLVISPVAYQEYATLASLLLESPICLAHEASGRFSVVQTLQSNPKSEFSLTVGGSRRKN